MHVPFGRLFDVVGREEGGAGNGVVGNGALQTLVHKVALDQDALVAESVRACHRVAHGVEGQRAREVFHKLYVNALGLLKQLVGHHADELGPLADEDLGRRPGARRLYGGVRVGGAWPPALRHLFPSRYRAKERVAELLLVVGLLVGVHEEGVTSTVHVGRFDASAANGVAIRVMCYSTRRRN